MRDFIENPIEFLAVKFHLGAGQIGVGFSNKAAGLIHYFDPSNYQVRRAAGEIEGVCTLTRWY